MRATEPVPQRANTPAPKSARSPQRGSAADVPDFQSSLSAAREARPAQDEGATDQAAEPRARVVAGPTTDARPAAAAHPAAAPQSGAAQAPAVARTPAGRPAAAQANEAAAAGESAAPAESTAGDGAASAEAATASVAVTGKPARAAPATAGKNAAKPGDSSDDDAGQLASLLPLLMGLQARATPADGQAASGSAGGDAGGGASGGSADTTAIGATCAASVPAISPAVTDPCAASAAVGAPAGAGAHGVARGEAALLDTISNALLGMAGARDGASAAPGAGHARADKAESAGTLAAASTDATASLNGSAAATNLLDAAQLQGRSGADAPLVMRTIDAPVGSAHWPDELASHLALMNTQGLQSAQMRLSPEHLGPLSVHISVHQGAASVWFQAAQPDTRAALEQALPRLRELFAAQGMALADAGVHREPPRDSRPASATAGVQPIAGLQSVTSVTSSTLARLGLVDAYA